MSDDQEQLLSRTKASELGLKPRPGAQPAEIRRGRYQDYPVFRREDLVPKQQRQSIPPETVDLLAAVFTVNRAAKRYRDTSQSHYQGRRHGLSRVASERKRDLYSAKELGLAAAYKAGRITFCGTHGRLAVYRGEGYCFHSLLIPADVPEETQALTDKTLIIESKPKGVGEARLKDAVFTLKDLPQPEGFRRSELPDFGRRLEPPMSPNDDDGDESDHDNSLEDDFDV